MKKRWLSVIVALAVVFSFVTGCKNNDEDDSVTYALSVDNSTLSFDAGSTGTINVTTNGTFTATSDTESVATVKTVGNAVTVTGVAVGSAIVTITCKEDATKKTDVTVTVNKTTMTLTLDYSAITNKANVAKASIYYGSGSDTTSDTTDDKYTTVAGTVDTTNCKITAELSKAYYNASKWYNGIKITLSDSSDTALTDIEWHNSSESTVDYFEYNADGVTLTAANVTEKTGTLTITLSGFTATVGKVTVAVGSADTITNSAVDATVSTSDSSVYTVTVSNTNCKASGYFNTDINVYGSDGTTELASKVSGSWIQFSESGMAITVTYVDTSETWNTVTTTGAWSETTAAPVQVVTAATLAALSISKLKIEVANCSAASASVWWVTAYTDTAWSNSQSLSWSDDISGYSITISDSSTIALFVTNGVYLAGSAGTLTVSYVASK